MVVRRRAPDRARARQPARERAQVLAADAPVRVRDHRDAARRRSSASSTRARASRRTSSSASSSRSTAAPTGDDVRGAGLGLAIARGFAEANGGRVWAESRPGQGATFALALPVVGSAGRVPRVSGQRVLVVDDEPQILRALATRLRGGGLRGRHGGDRRGGARRGRVRPPDAVILDLVLPDGSGTEVCRELRTWTEAPVIVLSAVGEEREKVAALDAGADDYVTKPFGVDELLARLRAVLRRAGADARAGDRRSASSRSTSPKRVVTRRRASACNLTPARVRPAARARRRTAGKLLTHRDAAARGLGPALPASRRTTCTSTSRSCGARSSPTGPARATCSPSRARATGWSIRRDAAERERFRRPTLPDPIDARA